MSSHDPNRTDASWQQLAGEVLIAETPRKPFWRSKKWLTAAIAALVPVANKLLGLDLDAAELAAVVLPLVGYVIGEAWADAGNRRE